ncbi:MAG: hypothetical protein Q4D38_10135 [Planctomycetia bacterium]|nr:hypothetical protein [Planctomycetia bacterium]
MLRGCTDSQNLTVLIGEKNEQLSDSKKKFLDQVKSRFEDFVAECYNEITSKIQPFVENNWTNNDNDNLKHAWECEVESLQIEQRTRKLVEEIESDCQKQLSEIISQIEQETTYILEVSKRVDIVGKIIDSLQKSSGKAGRIAKGLFNVATGILACFEPISALLLRIGVAVGTTVVTTVRNTWHWLWHGETVAERTRREQREREEQIAERKRSLKDSLMRHAEDIKKGQESQLQTVFENLEKSLKDAQDRLSQFQGVMTELFHQQGDLMNQLFQRVRELNKKMVLYLMKLTDSMECQKNVKEVLRVPGEMLCILVTGDLQPLKAKRPEWEDILKENVCFVNYSSENVNSMIEEILLTPNFSINRDCLEIKIEGDFNGTRAKLVEQLTGLRTKKK